MFGLGMHTIIDVYLQLLSKHNPCISCYLIYNTQMFPYMISHNEDHDSFHFTNTNFSEVIHWGTRFGNIFKKEYIFQPMNHVRECHWVLVVVSMLNKKINCCVHNRKMEQDSSQIFRVYME